MKLAAAKYRIDDGTADVDPSRDPEHLPPALQSVLTTREEEDDSACSRMILNLNVTVNYRMYFLINPNIGSYSIVLYSISYIGWDVSGILQIKLNKYTLLLLAVVAITYFILL